MEACDKRAALLHGEHGKEVNTNELRDRVRFEVRYEMERKEVAERDAVDEQIRRLGERKRRAAIDYASTVYEYNQHRADAIERQLSTASYYCDDECPGDQGRHTCARLDAVAVKRQMVNHLRDAEEALCVVRDLERYDTQYAGCGADHEHRCPDHRDKDSDKMRCRCVSISRDVNTLIGRLDTTRHGQTAQLTGALDTIADVVSNVDVTLGSIESALGGVAEAINELRKD